MRRAIVMGGGLGGICAAAALAGSVESVIVVERDRLDLEEPQARRGVPQSDQLHNLLSAAQTRLEGLLPGFGERLLRAGAVRARVSAETHVFEFGVRMPERDLGLNLVSARRPTIEHVARQMLAELGAVRILQETAVTGLDICDSRVYGVFVDRPGSPVQRLDADLVVDALGSASPVPSWLGRLDVRIKEERRRVDQWYVSGMFRRKATDVPPRFYLVFPTPPRSRGGLVSPADQQHVYLSLNGRKDDPPPRTHAEVFSYAQTLEDPAIAECLTDLEPVTAPRIFRKTNSVWRHYEMARPRVEGLLPLGDSLASLNPLFGQGMSVAATEAAALAELARSDLTELTGRYLDAAAGAVRRAWDLGAGVDPAEEWQRLLLHPDNALRFGRLLAADPNLHRTYVGVWHLLEPASAIPLEDLIARGVLVDPDIVE